MVTITLPLQPLVWLLRRSFYAACEEACDDWAVASGSDPVDLATALTAWVNHSGHRQVLVAIGMSSTKARTLRLLALRAKPVAHLTFRWRWCSVAAAIVVVAGLAIAQSPNDERLHERAPAPDVIESTNTAQPTKPEEVSSEQNVTTYSDEFTISGACVDENKKPLADVDVRLFVLDYANLQLNSGRSDNMQRELQTTRTDASGRFEFSDVDPQQAPNRPFALVVIALSPGKATAMRLLSPAPAREQTIELTLLSATTLQGRVTTESGTPVAGAVVSVGCGLLNPVPGLCAAVTDNDGRYLISDLRPFDIAAQKPQPTGDGGYDMISGCFAEVRHPDYARERFTYTRLPSSVDVTIRRAAVVEGQIVLDENGEPAVGAIVEIYNDTVGPANWTRTKTDTNGHYRLEMLPPGTYRLSAALKGRPNLFRKEVSLTSGHNQLNLRMEKGGVVKGRVVDNTTGKPIELGPNETMSISPHEPRGAWYQGMPSAQIQRDGTFTLLLPAGRNYLAMYFGKNWRGVNTDKLSRDGIDVSKGRSVDLEIRVTPRTPDDDRPPKPLSPKQAAQLAERAAIAAIKQLGGWVTTEQIDGEEHVVEVNMVYHEDELRGRQENRLLSDECLSYVRKFTKLKKLLLTGEQATDAALANLSGMQSLETVMIWDASAITDAGVAHLATLPNLKLVHISNAQITDEALRYFSGVPDLERISLQGNHFTDDGLAYIKDMTQLKALILGLGRNEITDDGLRFLTRLTNLERLDLQQSTVSDAGLQHLRHLKRLNSLWLGGTAVTNAGLDELHWSLPKLQKGEAIQY